jgi:hypothetical protein
MGAGCYYTHDDNAIENQRAFWIDLQRWYEDEETGEMMVDEHIWEDTILNIEHTFLELGYQRYDSKELRWENNMFEILIESTYDGDGAVIKLNPLELEPGLYGLALYNHDRSYDRIKRALLKEGYTLRIATSGYTSEELTD